MTEYEDQTPQGETPQGETGSKVETLSQHRGFKPRLVTADSEFPAPCQEVIDELEGLLRDAKSGSLRGVAFATITHSGLTGNGWKVDRDDANFRSLGFGVSALNHRFYESTVATLEPLEPPGA